MPIPVVLSPLGLPVRAVTANAPTMQVASNGIGLPIRISDLGVPFVVLGLEPAGQAPVLTSAPTMTPNSGPVGTVFTITPGSYTSETPITRLGQLRQNGAVVATRTGSAAFNFTSTSFGPLVWTETVSNDTGSAAPASVSAIISKQLQEFYDSGTIGIHLRTDGVTPTGGPATAIANEGGAGSTFNATVVGTPLPVSGNFLQSTLTTGYPMTANPADIVGVRLIWVAQPASATGTYRYFGQNESINTNIRINNGTTLNLISNRTGTNVTVVIGGIPSSAAARIFEIEMTPTEARLWVNGTMIGTASHPWTAFNIRSLTQGNSPTTQLFEGQLGDVMGVVSGRGDTDRAIAAARYYLDQRYALGLGFPAPANDIAPTLTGGSLEVQ